MYINICKIKVRYVETDKMGIVHHSNYYIWFEEARGEFIKQIDFTYEEMEKMGIMLPVVETQCKYKSPSFYGDELTIETFIKELTPVKIIFNYKVIRENDGKVIAAGATKHAFVNNSLKIINLKKHYIDLWNKLETLI